MSRTHFKIMGRGSGVWCLVSGDNYCRISTLCLLLARRPVPFTDHRPPTTDHSTRHCLQHFLLLSVDPVSPNDSELTHRYGAHDVRGELATHWLRLAPGETREVGPESAHEH